jgi:hypothetical protein
MDARRDARLDAHELTEDVARVADEAAEKAGSLARSVVSAIGRLVGLLSQLLTVLPAVPSRILAVVSTLLLRLGTASAEQAGLDRPVVDTSKRTRRKAIMWFAGGFTVGAASGYTAAQVVARREDMGPTNVTALPERRDGAGAIG